MAHSLCCRLSLCSLADGQAESENARDEAIHTKMASRANSERGKMYQSGSGSASGYRGGDDYPLFSESGYGSRRGYGYGGFCRLFGFNLVCLGFYW